MNNLSASLSEKHVVEALISKCLAPLGGSPDYANTEEGYLTTISFLLPENPDLVDAEPIIQDQWELKNKFPNGFHILRVTNFTKYKTPGSSSYSETIQIVIEALAKQEGELSAEEKAEEAELKKRVKAEQELEAESLILDSHERAVVDLIRASDETIPPYDEMKDAVKKIVRSHIKTLQDLMRL